MPPFPESVERSDEDGSSEKKPGAGSLLDLGGGGCIEQSRQTENEQGDSENKREAVHRILNLRRRERIYLF